MFVGVFMGSKQARKQMVVSGCWQSKLPVLFLLINSIQHILNLVKPSSSSSLTHVKTFRCVLGLDTHYPSWLLVMPDGKLQLNFT